jgi:5-methylcytosine-specific restriction enzyme B
MDTTPAATPATAGAPHVRAATTLLTERCLRRGRGLLAPGRSLWSGARLGELAARLERAAARAGRPHAAPAAFELRWRRMLAHAGDDGVALAGELLYVHLLFPSSIGGTRKRALLEATWARLPVPPPLPRALGTALDHGIAPAGVAYTRQRLSQLAWLAAAGAHLRGLAPRARAAVLEAPDRAAAALHDLPARGGAPQRSALLHLLHPRVFPPVTSARVRDRLLRVFASHVPAGAPDPDSALAAVHAALVPQYGAGFSFFDPVVATRWQ